jgi:hypothetical protein
MTDISFFIVKEPTKPKPKAKATGISKRDRAAIRTYLAASATERKAILRDQASIEERAKLASRRAWRRAYQQQYRAMRMLATVIL